MKRLSVFALALLAIAFTTGTSRQAAAQAGEGWKQLFDGKSLDGWSQTGEANWRVEDGAIVADKGKGGHLVSKESYKDVHIYAEFWADDKANSGIFVRCEPGKIGAKTCYEMNIFDARPDPSYGTGGIVDVAKVTTPIKTGGRWNTYEIRAQGSHLVVTLNGTKTVDVQDAKHARGPFALQWGAGVVKFRSVQIRPL